MWSFLLFVHVSKVLVELTNSHHAHETVKDDSGGVDPVWRWDPKESLQVEAIQLTEQELHK